jgi:hypothetical protein
MIPFDELCEALHRWSRQREMNGEPPIVARSTSAEAPRRPEPRAAVAAAAAAGGSVQQPPSPEPAPPAAMQIESEQPRPPDDQTGEIDLDDVIDV